MPDGILDEIAAQIFITTTTAVGLVDSANVPEVQLWKRHGSEEGNVLTLNVLQAPRSDRWRAAQPIIS